MPQGQLRAPTVSPSPIRANAKDKFLGSNAPTDCALGESLMLDKKLYERAEPYKDPCEPSAFGWWCVKHERYLKDCEFERTVLEALIELDRRIVPHKVRK